MPQETTLPFPATANSSQGRTNTNANTNSNSNISSRSNLDLEPPNHVKHPRDVVKLFTNRSAFRLLLSFLFVLSSAYTVLLLQQLSDMRWVSSGSDQQPLLDVLHQLIPRLAFMDIVAIFLGSEAALTALTMVFVSRTWGEGFVILRRFFWISGILYYFRGLVMTVTTMPSPRQGCIPELPPDASAGMRLWLATKSIAGGATACTNQMFSGHTQIFVSLALQWHIYVKRFRVLRWVVYLWTATGIVLLIATRYHYTVDCLMAIYVTWAMHRFYFGLVTKAVERRLFADPTLKDRAEKVLGDQNADKTVRYLEMKPRAIGGNWLVRLVAWVDGVDLRWELFEGEQIGGGKRNGTVEPLRDNARH